MVAGALTVETVGEMFKSPVNFAKNIAVDLAKVTELDSAGVALLVHWKQQAESKNCSFSIASPSEQVVSMLRVSGLEDMV